LLLHSRSITSMRQDAVPMFSSGLSFRFSGYSEIPPA
jgi:hypothetical protein